MIIKTLIYHDCYKGAIFILFFKCMFIIIALAVMTVSMIHTKTENGSAILEKNMNMWAKAPLNRLKITRIAGIWATIFPEIKKCLPLLGMDDLTLYTATNKWILLIIYLFKAIVVEIFKPKNIQDSNLITRLTPLQRL